MIVVIAILKMRNKNHIVFIYIVLTLILSCKQDNPAPGFTYMVAPIKQQIIIDGNLDDPAWQEAHPITLLDNNTGDSVKDTSVLTWLKTCYDDQNLYLAFTCNDPDIWGYYTSRDDYLWNEEVVEVFIDTDNDPNTYVELEVSPCNVLFDSFITNPDNIDFVTTAKFDLPDIKTAVTLVGTLNVQDDTDRKWIVEMAIPFKNLIQDYNYHNLTKLSWKINFYRINRDKNKNTEGFAWSPTYSGFHKPAKFGTLIFIK